MNAAISKTPPLTHFHLEMDRWSAPFWAATAAHRLDIPRCAACKRFRMPPSPVCPACQSSSVDWITVTGEGVVYSFTIITNPPFPEAASYLPYVPVIVALNGAAGVRLVSALIDAPLDAIAIGGRVTLVWQDCADGVTLPRFRLA